MRPAMPKRFRGAFSARWPAVALAAALLMLLPAQVRAHKVTVFAWVDGHTVHTESKFSGGRVAKGARIEVYNSAGKKLLEGLTDEQGRFAFTPPRPEDLRIVLIGGTGHRNEWRVAAGEFAGGPAVGTSAEAGPSTNGQPAVPADTGREAAATLSATELQAVVETALDKKLAPIMHRLGALNDGPTLADIVGGLGYIVGLVGLAAYFNARRKS